MSYTVEPPAQSAPPAEGPPAPSAGFFSSKGGRLLAVFVLIVLMTIPLMMMGAINSERQRYSNQTTREIGAQWGGAQTLAGPFLVIPAERETFVGEGDERKSVTESRVLVVGPDRLGVDIDAETETRQRGIFETTVYRAKAAFTGEFSALDLGTQLRPNEALRWDSAQLLVNVSDPRAFENNVTLDWNGEALSFEPAAGQSSGLSAAQAARVKAPMARGGGSGLVAAIPKPQSGGSFAFTLQLRGSGQLHVTPMGRATEVSMKADWPHPSFNGAFLPRDHEITDQGFTANWSVPYLARGFPQVWSANGLQDAQSMTGGSSFGLSFFQPVNFYHKVDRALKYAIVVIGLTFITVFLLEGALGRRVHAVQYLLVGLAQCVFYLLLLAFSEQVGFAAAYGIGAAATIGLLTLYVYGALKGGTATWTAFGSLVTLYAFLYLLLQSQDYALLIGAIAAFLALAATMYATRDVNWWESEG